MLRVLQVLNDISVENQLYKNQIKPTSPIAKIQFSIPEKISNEANNQQENTELNGKEITSVNYSYKKESDNNNSNGNSNNKQLVKLKVYDVMGHDVATLVDEPLSPGNYEVEWYGPCFANKYKPGVYFYQVCTTGESNNLTDSLQMLIIK